MNQNVAFTSQEFYTYFLHDTYNTYSLHGGYLNLEDSILVQKDRFIRSPV